MIGIAHIINHPGMSHFTFWLVTAISLAIHPGREQTVTVFTMSNDCSFRTS